jgi:hypothetical protein
MTHNIEAKAALYDEHQAIVTEKLQQRLGALGIESLEDATVKPRGLFGGILIAHAGDQQIIEVLSEYRLADRELIRTLPDGELPLVEYETTAYEQLVAAEERTKPRPEITFF